MKNKILIVDDSKKIHERFSKYLANENLEILIAKNLFEAEEIAQREMPPAATVDFSLGPKEPNGNDIGAKLKEINPNIKLAGITYGDPKNFDEGIFDIRESKGINDSTYVNIVNLLLSSENPGEEYKSSQPGEKIPENILVASILLQGYNFARNLQKGIQPVEGTEFAIPSEEKTLDMLNFENIGDGVSIKPMEVYAAMCGIDYKIADDVVVENFFKAVDDKRYGDVKDADAVHVEKTIAGLITDVYGGE